MSNNIKLRKGLDLPLAGAAPEKVVMEITPSVVGLKPTDFKGLVPRLLVKEGDHVKAGSPLFADKMRPEILFTSPVSGTVSGVVRGEKRKLLAVTVKPDGQRETVDFGVSDLHRMSPDDIKALLLKSGLWASIIQRPYGTIANPAASPKAVFVSGWNSAPLAPRTEYVLDGQWEYVQTGLSAIKKMTDVEIFLGLNADTATPLSSMKDVTVKLFKGKHPAGNVGVQISHISPILKGETVWTVTPLMLAAIGKLIATGKLDLSRLVAVCGPDLMQRGYVKACAGMAIRDIDSMCYVEKSETRLMDGDALSGEAIEFDSFLGFQSNQLTFIEEGEYFEMFGWLKPVRSSKHSISAAYFKLPCCHKTYRMDTNTHGGSRPFVFNNVYSDVLPMDIFPVYLAKACLEGNIDKMEQYGIYEVLPEDFATCEYVCPSKIRWQQIIADGIDLMLKEMA